MLFGVVTGPTLSLAQKQLQTALPYVDGVEWRLDLFSDLDFEDVKGLLESWPKLTLLTYRGATEEQVRKWLALCPDFFDIDMCEERGLIEAFPKTRFILSFHDYEKMPEDLDALLQSMRQHSAYAYKIAAHASSTLDALRMLSFVRRHRQVIGIAMGEEGLASRVLGPIVGNLIDYASLGSMAAIHGQLDVRELCTTYRYHQLKRDDPIYALIGDPVCYSVSHETHNRLLAELKLPGVYLKLKLRPEEIGLFRTLATELPFRGFSVTMPLKLVIGRHLDEPTQEPVNTISIEQGRWLGANTDGWAAMELLEQYTPLEGQRCLILGSGGVAHAFALACRARGGIVMIASRTKERALVIAKEVDAEVYSLDDLPDYDILLQGTSVGMSPSEEQMPIEEKQLLAHRIVLEAVSSVEETPLLKSAKRKECRTIDGKALFIKQAAAQFQLWLNRPAGEASRLKGDFIQTVLKHRCQKCPSMC